MRFAPLIFRGNEPLEFVEPIEGDLKRQTYLSTNQNESLTVRRNVVACKNEQGPVVVALEQ